MPRRSQKQVALSQLDELIQEAACQNIALGLLGIGDSDSSRATFLLRCQQLRERVASSRYFQRGSYRKRTPKFNVFLASEGDHPEALKDTEFLFHFRVCRESFWELHGLVSSNPVFKRISSDSRGPAPPPASHQLLVLLKYYGSDGNAARSENLASFFGVGKGTIDFYRRNALNALLSLEDDVYFWPTRQERKAIARRIKESHLFPHCVGLIDGTLLPLATKPMLHGENYHSRKKRYAVAMLVVCDDQARITYYHVGWPGSVHDNRVWRNCKLCKKQDEMFADKEYLLGDSAFTAGPHMVPPFKTIPGQQLTHNQTEFNTLLAKPRVKSEHCIGRLKGRFPLLRNIPLRLAKKADMKRIVKYVRGAVVIHNYLIDEDIDEGWMDELENESDLGDEAVRERNFYVDQNDSRRSRILLYLSELQATNIN